ncbi:MAG: phage tail protein [Acutalibacteraceae bacterium]|nr:phage tail protein [Acutalibacteraceae bacterium]
MIQLQIDGEKAMKEILAVLGDANKKAAPRVLSKAVNATADEARKLLASKAQETYAIKSAGFKKAMDIDKAKPKTPVATLRSDGGPIELFKFKTSPATYKTGENKPETSKGKVKKSHGGMKNLLHEGRWAFVTKFSNGHKSMVQRTTDKRFPIKTLLSPSIPQMIGNEEDVYGEVQPVIQKMLMNHIYKELDKELLKGIK